MAVGRAPCLPPPQNGGQTLLSQLKEKAFPRFSHSSSCRDMEVPVGPSAAEESCPPETSASAPKLLPSLRNVVQITVVKAQDLVKLFWNISAGLIDES